MLCSVALKLPRNYNYCRQGRKKRNSIEFHWLFCSVPFPFVVFFFVVVFSFRFIFIACVLIKSVLISGLFLFVLPVLLFPLCVSFTENWFDVRRSVQEVVFDIKVLFSRAHKNRETKRHSTDFFQLNWGKTRNQPRVFVPSQIGVCFIFCSSTSKESVECTTPSWSS